MFTVFIKLYISDKCNKDWLTSNAPQHSKAVKELKQLAQEFDRNLHFAVIPSSTVERGESFAEVLYEGDAGRSASQHRVHSKVAQPGRHATDGGYPFCA